MLPFTIEQFLGVFANYNRAIWPAQVLAYLMGGLAFSLVFRKGRWSDQIIAGILASMWAWTGIVYHLIFFASINKLAYVFGALFAMQAAAFIYFAASRSHLNFGYAGRPAGFIGVALVVYAAAIYPLFGLEMGQLPNQLPMFGVTPCPVTIFSFGMLLLTRAPVSRWLLVIPFLWSLVGGSAAIFLRVPQDWALLMAGIVSLALLIVRDRRMAPAG
ncbi:DUF6064 family protein [Bradyrhizobium sp. 62B]|jgi:Family of unknown function (DUF6064)|uniref:DUF6064 family protein n=1 Tax=Bradyrhizobium sp. 62B TaxID=2898442 RepID=UPI001B8A0EA1|nr:DUF6064 family protein [Bradyrhizobium diazoefficiens]MBR0698693.1 hypothetical protein [Bradyrhizobium diazoefficiens]MBR0767029.1 hypothetical protein [Bradyrhizobium diazoefficiens]WIW46368.1 DUF6064 family protein [Bradyrhizobium sp. 62B]